MYIHEAETDNNVDVVVAPIVIKSLALLIYLIYTNTHKHKDTIFIHKEKKKMEKLNWFSFTTSGLI